MINFRIEQTDVEVIDLCPVCDCVDIKNLSTAIVNKVEYLQTSICSQCGFVFRNRRPSLNWFIKNWSRRDETQKTERIDFVNEDIEIDRMNRYKKTGQFLKKIIKGRKLIDIGSGTGTGLKAYQDEGFEVVGLEPDPSRARVGVKKYGVNIVESTVGEYCHNSSKDKYDIATCLHSLEHFHSPLSIIKSIAKLVKSDGYIYIEVPDFVNFVSDWNDSIFLAHLNNFSDYNLRLLGMRAGLKPVIKSFPKSNGYDHLGILFKKDPGYNPSLSKDNFCATRLLHYAEQAYKTGLEIQHNNTSNLVFFLPIINDISLSYKAVQSIDATVSKNYLQRGALWSDTQKAYIVGDTIQDEKTNISKAEGLDLSSTEGNQMQDIAYIKI
jgi:SAM-dependent methyltransferase